ncbi:MAG TPA: Xaa-Pro peptidase family protein [Chthoniobacterales bacterium]|jgi:Xaa-Pro aminopeptidase|nr:Xaa-Pro peptidase family protein [Chthoniobacterales bacterium]
MNSTKRFVLATISLCSMFAAPMRAEPTPAERVNEIQKALQAAKIDGWLFYDFRGSDPLALRILTLGEKASGSRRWFYFIPAQGEPTRIVHSIERGKLDALPGQRLVYRGWEEQHAHLRETLSGKSGQLRVAMQYSPKNDIPYISRVDAGTIELIRSFGVEIVTSAELVQQFEAVLSPEQKRSHVEGSDKLHRVLMDAFGEIARRIRGDTPTSEYDIQQFIARRLDEEGMTPENGIVAVNANAANPHYFPTKESAAPIKRGDFVLLDIVSKLRQPDAICTDQTWTGFVGETVPEDHIRIFNIVREARDAASEFVRKNVREGKKIRGADVDDVSRGVIKRAGFGEQFTHRTGHSIGEECHGNGVNIDNFETRDSRFITAGVCFSIEPGIYLEGKFGVRSEIDVYVGEKEIEVTGQPIQTEIIPILKLP